MKNWKALIAGFLILCVLPILPGTVVFSEEAGEEEEAAEEAIPES